MGQLALLYSQYASRHTYKITRVVFIDFPVQNENENAEFEVAAVEPPPNPKNPNPTHKVDCDLCPFTCPSQLNLSPLLSGCC